MPKVLSQKVFVRDYLRVARRSGEALRQVAKKLSAIRRVVCAPLDAHKGKDPGLPGCVRGRRSFWRFNGVSRSSGQEN